MKCISVLPLLFLLTLQSTDRLFNNYNIFNIGKHRYKCELDLVKYVPGHIIITLKNHSVSSALQCVSIWINLRGCKQRPPFLLSYYSDPTPLSLKVSVAPYLCSLYLFLPFVSQFTPCLYHTAKTKYRNFETNIPRKGISGSRSQFPHSCVCERFIYSHDRPAYSAGGNMWTDPWTI